MQCKQIGLIVACLTALSACSTRPLTQPTEPLELPRQRPSECLRACPEVPYPASAGEADMGVWRHEAVYSAGECRRMHDACRGFVP